MRSFYERVVHLQVKNYILALYRTSSFTHEIAATANLLFIPFFFLGCSEEFEWRLCCKDGTP